MTSLTAKSLGIWLLMVIAAIVNGLIRDTVLTPLVSGNAALPLSGITLSALVFGIVWFSAPLLGTLKEHAYWLIGLLWVSLTLAFEYLFGHYVAGQTWQEVNQIFNPATGNLFIVVLVVILIAPWAAAKLRHIT